MTENDTSGASLLRESWDYVTATPERADEFALKFYAHLTMCNPGVRALFPASMSGQRDRFLRSLGHIVSSGLASSLMDYLTRLGHAHASRYGALTEHYNAVGESLLYALEQMHPSEESPLAGPRWTAERAELWALAYSNVADVMREAASRAPSLMPLTVLSVDAFGGGVTLRLRPGADVKESDLIALHCSVVWVRRAGVAGGWCGPLIVHATDIVMLSVHVPLDPMAAMAPRAMSQLVPGDVIDLAREEPHDG